MFKTMVTGLKETLGDASKWGILYFATDPIDTPDYEKFCVDFSDITSMFPQTTTAIAFKDVPRMKKLLKLSNSRGCRVDRFSVLSLGVLKKIHKSFTPDELTNVELIVQNPDSTQIKSTSGRQFEKVKVKPELVDKELSKFPILKHDKDAELTPDLLPGTICCISGFLVNLLEKTVKLISPWRAEEKWPLGYIIYDQGTFTDGESFIELIHQMIERSMPLSVTEMDTLRFRRGLKYESNDQGFMLSDTYRQTIAKNQKNSSFMKTIGEYLHEGDKTAGEIAMLSFYKHGMPEQNTIAMLDELLKSGVLDEEPRT